MHIPFFLFWCAFTSFFVASTSVPSPPIPFDDGMSQNLLLSTFPNVNIILQSIRNLSSTDHFLASGIVTFPAGMTSHDKIQTAPTVQRFDNPSQQRTSSLLMRVSSNGSLIWAVRTVLSSQSARFAVLPFENNADSVILVGSTTQAVNTTALRTTNITLDNVTTLPVASGPVVAVHALDTGALRNVSIHADSAKANYQFVLPVIMTDSSSNSTRTNTATVPAALAIGYCPRSSPLFTYQYTYSVDDDVSFAVMGGICVAMFTPDTPHLALRTPVSVLNATASKTSSITQDTLLDVAVSADGSTVHVVVGRSIVINSDSNFLHALISFDVADLGLSVPTWRGIPDEIQPQTHVVVPHKNAVVISYIARTNNKEQLIVNYNFTTRWAWTLDANSLQSRTVISTVSATCVNSNGDIAIVLYTASIVDSSVWNFDLVNRLTNGRVALITISFPIIDNENTQEIFTKNTKPLFIAQSWTTSVWEPYACSPMYTSTNSTSNPHWLVAGVDKHQFGTPLHGSSEPLAITVRKPVAPPTPSPTSTPSVTPTISTSPSPLSPNSGNGVCIGASSSIQGVSLLSHIETHPLLRLQTHVNRRLKLRGKMNGERTIQMHCAHFKNRRSTLCATSWHVVKWKNSFLYMHEVCKLHLNCTSVRDVPINFKGKCGRHIQITSDFAVTMHTGTSSVTATQAKDRECWMQAWMWPLWMLTTL